ncbi:uncharacterized protein LOC122505861 [Leptopilina heterotoma]|uniref:uncharacterized protein LOC122505861 n=1 Tax=Leptopilina heterotoma TaxID=63436 RepID=UPI001CA9B84C|nr:uncharacterized protein LOC122505861 [Leptopilina heterotoma]
MSSVSKIFLLCLIACILHVNEGLEFAGAGKFYTQKLQLSMMEVFEINNFFMEQLNSISKKYEQKYLKKYQECQEKFINPDDIFSAFTTKSKMALLKLCSQDGNIKVITKSKKDCVKNIKEYLGNFLNNYSFDKVHKCLNDDNTSKLMEDDSPKSKSEEEEDDE